MVRIEDSVKDILGDWAARRLGPLEQTIRALEQALCIDVVIEHVEIVLVVNVVASQRGEVTLEGRCSDLAMCLIMKRLLGDKVRQGSRSRWPGCVIKVSSKL